MEAIILDSNFEKIGVLDTFDSFIWTDRYNEQGDFEIYKRIDFNFVSILSDISYLSMAESEHLMVVEDIRIITDVEAGNKFLIKGRSLESILERRIILDVVSLSGNLQDAIEQLLIDNIINPDDPDRQISLFEFSASIDSAITSLEINNQFFGVSIYKIIMDICIERNIGFKVILTETGTIQFSLYAGINRSYDQETYPYVVFSPEYDNLKNSEYQQTTEFLKTVALVAGEEGIGNVRKSVLVTAGDGGTDLQRREIFIDASDVTSTLEDGTALPEEDYLDLLVTRGSQELAKNSVLEQFNGQADINGPYIYGEDFFMGDVLQIANEYGKTGKARIIDMIYSEDSSGYVAFPTFSTI